MVAGDDQPKLAGEIGFFDEAKSLTRIIHAAHCDGLPPEERHDEMSLEGVVIDQENRCH
jgi:hypothetical protein